MENNLANKQKLFANFWWQEVCFNNAQKSHKSVDGLAMSTPNIQRNYLLLTPLSQITDEDAVELAKISYSKLELPILDNSIRNVGIGICNSILTSRQADYLRSRSYAIDWMDVPVKQQIEYGWVKLRE